MSSEAHRFAESKGNGGTIAAALIAVLAVIGLGGVAFVKYRKSGSFRTGTRNQYNLEGTVMNSAFNNDGGGGDDDDDELLLIGDGEV